MKKSNMIKVLCFAAVSASLSSASAWAQPTITCEGTVSIHEGDKTPEIVNQVQLETAYQDERNLALDGLTEDYNFGADFFLEKNRASLYFIEEKTGKQTSSSAFYAMPKGFGAVDLVSTEKLPNGATQMVTLSCLVRE
ncbi:MAG TPA: hypothetical protein VJB59_13980 [Bdellovibrionota bacterium]|nr:hypothetical protein [Bdellovibrionota bacterium]